MVRIRQALIQGKSRAVGRRDGIDDEWGSPANPDGRETPEEKGISNTEFKGREYYKASASDITERLQSDRRQELSIRILETLNRRNDIERMIPNILQLVKEMAGFEAVGIRLGQGDDFPYYTSQGFPERFLVLERHLCAREESGEPVVMNLAVNARDAMPQDGKLIIETAPRRGILRPAPGLRTRSVVLYMSGYTDDVIVRHGILESGVPCIRKPFERRELALMIRGLMGR